MPISCAPSYTHKHTHLSELHSRAMRVRQAAAPSRPSHASKLIISHHVGMGCIGHGAGPGCGSGVPPSETDNFRSSLVPGVWPNSLELAFV